MIRISIRDSKPNKQRIQEYLEKHYPPAVQEELKGELTGNKWDEAYFTKKQRRRILKIQGRMFTLKFDEPQDIQISDIVNNPNNKDLLKRIEAIKNQTISSDSKSSGAFLRNPQNVEIYKNMDPSTQPPVAVNEDNELLYGFHRTIASIFRGDKTIKAYVFKRYK